MAELHSVFVDPAVRRYLLDDRIVPEEWVREEVHKSGSLFSERGCGLWSVRERGCPVIVGFAGFRHFFEPPRLQLLYGLVPSRWGLGLATEAARAVLAHAFEVLGLDRVEAAADAPNEASIGVMLRLGMSPMERLDDGPPGTVVYAVERSEWEADAGR